MSVDSRFLWLTKSVENKLWNLSFYLDCRCLLLLLLCYFIRLNHHPTLTDKSTLSTICVHVSILCDIWPSKQAKLTQSDNLIPFDFSSFYSLITEVKSLRDFRVDCVIDKILVFQNSHKIYLYQLFFLLSFFKGRKKFPPCNFPFENEKKMGCE